jgi:CubicO group peptidase (beta-lactamase class C family)
VRSIISSYARTLPWQSITVRHLLTHTAGLVREAPGFYPYKLQRDLDVIRTAYSLPLRFQPGEQWEYCNLGYFVLAEIIQTVSGKPWGDFLAERVFAPQGMTATRATSVADIVPNRADGYAWSAGKFQNMENWPALRPSGAFLSTVLDLARWEAALLTDRVLKESSKPEMWTPVKLNDGRRHPYGFGWQLLFRLVRTTTVRLWLGHHVPDRNACCQALDRRVRNSSPFPSRPRREGSGVPLRLC